MPWYKLELTGGKGHANHEVKYVWSDLKWSAGEKQCQWDSWAGEFGYERMWDGHVTYVKRLPVAVRDMKVRYCLDAIESNREMLARLLQRSVYLDELPKYPIEKERV